MPLLGPGERGIDFRMRIILGMSLSRFLLFHWNSLRDGFKVHPTLWVQKKLVYFGNSTQNTIVCPNKLLRQFLRHSPLYFF